MALGFVERDRSTAVKSVRVEAEVNLTWETKEEQLGHFGV